MLKPITPRLKTPVKHHNTQIKATNQLLEMIPPHKLYSEAFGGGAALFFAKEPAKINVINDPNGEIVNFYETAVGDFDALETEIAKTLHSREQFQRARAIYANPEVHTRVERAWAVWAMSKMSFMYTIDDAGFTISHGERNQMQRRVMNAKMDFTLNHKRLLEQCTVEHDEPLEVIRRYDRTDAFHYVAPPLDGTSDVAQLLHVLSMVRGKFLLAVCASATVRNFAELNDWMIYDLDRPRKPSVNIFKPALKNEEWVVTNY